MNLSPVYHNSRPDGELLPQEAAAFDLLDRLGIEYDRVSHDAAFNMELCAEVGRVLDVSVCKNLFLCNRQKTQFYLLCMMPDKPFHTKDLSAQIHSARLSFAPEELLARVENVLRLSGRGQALLQAGDVTVDVGTRQVKKAGQEVALTPTEYHLLLVLLHNKNIALYRDTLYERVWGRDAELDTRTLDIHIHRLRKKLGWQQMIRTIPRVGYRLEETS